MEGPLNSEEGFYKAAWERSAPADYALRLLALESFKRLQSRFWNNVLYALDDEKLFESRAAQRFCLKAPALPLPFAAHGGKAAHFLQMKRPLVATSARHLSSG